MYKLIWADKLAIFWAAIVCVFFFLVAGMASVVGILSQPYAMFLFFGIPWSLLRLLDWLFGGPAYRRRYVAR